jgi:hypothetical protein
MVDTMKRKERGSGTALHNVVVALIVARSVWVWAWV